MYAVFFTKCIEPKQRNKDGLKWVVHRFPIKGGISIRDVLWIEMQHSRSAILRELMMRSPLLSPPANARIH